ncbi:hypothetical protein BKA81DRAFT_218712 [Phyllosticta paracitricarpa]
MHGTSNLLTLFFFAFAARDSLCASMMRSFSWREGQHLIIDASKQRKTKTQHQLPVPVAPHFSLQHLISITYRQSQLERQHCSSSKETPDTSGSP